MTGRRSGAFAAAEVPAFVLLALTACAGGARSEAGGPLLCGELDPPVPQGGSFYAHVNRPFSFSDVVIWNCGEETAVLDEVRLVDLDPHLHFYGAVVGTLLLKWISGDERFPPDFPYPTRPLQGFEVRPTAHPDSESGVQISIGLAPRMDGIYGFRLVKLLYHVGAQDYELIVPYAVVTCAPFKRYADHPELCVPPDPPTVPG